MTYSIVRVLKSRGYNIYRRPYELNIVGVRSSDIRSGRFDDWLHVFYKLPSGKWVHQRYSVTTDPGTYWLRKPMMPQGTAILKQGQYKGVYGLGLHAGKHTALCQLHGKVAVIRDYNRDAILDFMNGSVQTGYFGINIHRANPQGVTQRIDQHSAGCQVFSSEQDFTEFLRLCRTHRALYGNKFTYTLIDHRAQIRQTLKTWFGIGTILTTSLFAWMKWQTISNKLKSDENND